MLKLFFAYVLVVPLIYGNWLGLLVGCAMILIVIIGLYLRSVITGEHYERVLDLICGLSLTSVGYAMIEAFINLIEGSGNSHRIAAVFSHPNYFGAIAGTVIIICAYKVLTNQGNKWFYYFVAMMNVISLYLSKSMFAFIEVFIGITVLLVVLKKYRLFALWLSAAATGAFLIFGLGMNLIPRLNDASLTIRIRQGIWSLAINQIKREPLLGHGFMSFSYLFNQAYQNRMIPHAHSIYLDMLLNFGVMGSGMFLWYFVKYYIAVLKTCKKQKNRVKTALILAVTAAVLVHGTTDLTLLWIQTAPLFLIIMAGQGSMEGSEQLKEEII